MYSQLCYMEITARIIIAVNTITVVADKSITTDGYQGVAVTPNLYIQAGGLAMKVLRLRSP